MGYPFPFIVEPAEDVRHTHTIILLHGRSSTAKEFATDLFALQTSGAVVNLRSRFPRVRWVFPDAGQRWCTAFKEERSAWFDTFSLDPLILRQGLQVSGLRDGVFLVQKIIEEEVARLGGRSDRVILGGFSQGSATALWSMFTGAAMTRGSLGAFVGISAWMPFLKEAREAIENAPLGSPENQIRDLRSALSVLLGIEPMDSVEAMETCIKMPFYLGHGTDDTVINVKSSRDISSILASMGSPVQVREYTGADRDGHWIKPPEQVDDIVEFLARLLETS